jgi:hypothetical protein
LEISTDDKVEFYRKGLFEGLQIFDDESTLPPDFSERVVGETVRTGCEVILAHFPIADSDPECSALSKLILVNFMLVRKGRKEVTRKFEV